MKQRFEEGVQFLAENGYNLFSVTACTSLPQEIVTFLNEKGYDLKKFPSLVVIGSAGLRLWEAIHASEDIDLVHPVNSFTERIIPRFIDEYLNASEIITLFPSQPPRRFPIQTFTHWLGMSHPTPLGKNIHPEFGLWHAYRAAFLTTANLPETPRVASTPPCEACIDKPCIKACPSGAVGEVKKTLIDFDRKKCYTFRLTENSICKDRCISRMACPVGREHRYTMPQMTHHYGCSRRKIIEKYNTNNQYGVVTV